MPDITDLLDLNSHPDWSRVQGGSEFPQLLIPTAPLIPQPPTQAPATPPASGSQTPIAEANGQ